mmetsp:Transcript_9518/g.14357  ORF Transcript_9518/g.14357 Transcript_9518/m.14357 type:complete len:96 (+) Transcript_9518:1387-1674(+)
MLVSSIRFKFQLLLFSRDLLVYKILHLHSLFKFINDKLHFVFRLAKNVPILLSPSEHVRNNFLNFAIGEIFVHVVSPLSQGNGQIIRHAKELGKR